jgi:hypothetical protein
LPPYEFFTNGTNEGKKVRASYIGVVFAFNKANKLPNVCNTEDEQYYSQISGGGWMYLDYGRNVIN